MHRLSILLFTLSLALGHGLLAQDSLAATPPPVPANPPTQVDDLPVNPPAFNPDVVPTRTTTEIWLSIGILVFGAVITLALLYFLGRRTTSTKTEDLTEIVRYPIVMVIVIGSIFLVTAGYGTDQMAPILGLMGTIAGYLMARNKPGSS